MAKKSIGISLQIPAALNLTKAQAQSLGDAVKAELATIQKQAPVQNLLSLPETNVFIRQPRQPQAAAASKKRAGSKSPGKR